MHWSWRSIDFFTDLIGVHDLAANENRMINEVSFKTSRVQYGPLIVPNIIFYPLSPTKQ